ncbi:MAG: DNA alkylation repair protein [Comamonadaceae bacterium]|nr:MAG: DNA alkylation repair protein [Comamonadaceae bacterium]
MSQTIEAPEATAAPALKNIFDAARFRHVADELKSIHPRFDSAAFLALTLPKIDDLSLMQRLRLMTESLHATLPADYARTIAILRKLAPRINSSFVTLVLPDYVSLYGQDHFETSMEALKFFTTFGSSEFAIREFIRRDPKRTLKVMKTWSKDANEHVRRLASEGSRPRLPWSFRLDALMADPELAAPILDALKTDDSLYVRKSVANHLNDITKLHPAWVMEKIESWPLDNPHAAWIARHALRTLIKQGDKRALTVIGAGQKPEVDVVAFSVNPERLRLGDSLEISLTLRSTSSTAQHLVIDYTIHYVKKSGASSGKVFKLKEVSLPAGASVTASRRQVIRDFTTRVHHAGKHGIDISVNGETLARGFFDLNI